MFLTFLFISYIPLISVVLFFLPQVPFRETTVITTYSIILLILWGLCTIFGILTMDLRLRGISTTLFSLGIILSFNDPYLLSFGIILTWIFFEFWFIVSQSQQLVREYSSYSIVSLERRKLKDTVQNQIFSFGFLAWVVLLVTWVVLFIAENFYIELGKELGPIGISISIAITFLLLLFQKLYGPIPKAG